MPIVDLEKFFADPLVYLGPQAEASPLKSLLRALIALKPLWDDFPMGVLVTDADGKILYYNKAQSEIDGMTRDFVIGKRLTEVYGPCPEPVLTDSCLIARRSLSNFVCVYRTCQGKMVNSSHWIYPLEVEGELVGALCLIQEFKDIKSDSIPIVSAYDESMQKLDRRPTLDNLVGHNAQLEAAIKTARAAASTNSNVLLSGETGTGKEVFAQGIHKASPNADKPFMAINCSAIPASLIEGILFGTAKGSFTGALDKPGLFECAGSGTLFLDEIDSLPRTLQAKLLRVLEERKVRRVGENKERAIDAKIISSVGCHPTELINGHKMRPDLFYRLAVVVVVIPPLRQRMDDLDELCHYFMQKFNYNLGKKLVALAPETRRLFSQYHWPGNIRELEHIIEGAMNMVGDEELLTPDMLPHHFVRPDGPRQPVQPEQATAAQPLSPLPPDEEAATQDLGWEVLNKERLMIEKALRDSRGRLKPAAEILGVSRQVLSYKLKKLGIDRLAYR